MLNELNKEQEEVVETTEGAVLVLAGAGSGKTRTIIYRSAYLINQHHVDPYNILIVTFTNKASSELRERLLTYFGINPSRLWVGTFHSICLRILRSEYKFTKFNSNFTIYDSDDQKSLLKKVYKKLDISKENFPLAQMKSSISKRKNEFLLPDDLQFLRDEGFSNRIYLQVYTEYQKELINNNCMDFDDIMVYTLKLFHEHKEVLQKYQEIFKYVMIDEYQDTNVIQYKLTSLLAEPDNNICVVGDDDQAIYSWRGADITNILKFDKIHKETKVIKLEQNYRSSRQILEIANQLISHNEQRHQKQLKTDIESVQQPVMKRLETDVDEARYIVDEIQNIQHEYGLKLNDIAVLYRTNSQSRLLETELIKQNLPYKIVGGINFYQRKEIKDILSYLKCIINPADNESFQRIINTPTRGIGKTTINAISNYAIDNRISLSDAILEVENIDLLSARAKTAVTKFANLLQKWREKLVYLNCFEITNLVISDIDILSALSKSDDPKLNSQADNIKEFISSTSQFREEYLQNNETEPFLEDFLNSVQLLTDLDRFDRDSDSINLLTIHNAKGLEFQAVFVAGIEEGLLPHNRSIYEDKGVEEERRLLYVAITRAKEYLYLTYASYRRINGLNDASAPSRFLSEIGTKTTNKTSFVTYPQAPKRKSLASVKKPNKINNNSKFRPGDKIHHEIFGSGMIISSNGEGDSMILTISFTTGLLKKINVKYVELI